MMKAVEVRGLSFRYEGSEEWAIREVNLEIDRGEWCWHWDLQVPGSRPSSAA